MSTPVRVPWSASCWRRGYGLGAMGLEGAVRLSMRKEPAAIVDEDERERAVQEHTARLQEHAKALNAARHFEIDDVVDPADTRAVVAAALSSADGSRRPDWWRPVDTW